MTKVKKTSTKNDIWNELQRVLAEQETKVVANAISPSVEKNRNETKALMKVVQGQTVDSVIKSISQSKIDTIKTLESVEVALNDKISKIAEFDKAIELKKKEIEEINQIEVGVNTLQALIQAQEQLKKDLEVQKDLMEDELAELSLRSKEIESDLKKQRQRETEEYEYDLKQKRKKELDEYDANFEQTKKENIEPLKKLRDEVGKESNDLRVATEKFDEEKEQFEKSKATLLEDLEKKLKSEHENEIRFMKQDYENKIAMLNKEVGIYLGELEDYNSNVVELQSKLKDAEKRNQELALKAIESNNKPTIIRETQVSGK